MRTYDENTRRIGVRVGERFVLQLPVVATAGFEWILRRQPDVAALRVQQVRAVGSPLGASSIQELEFSATRSGTGTLLLECKRVWENREGTKLAIEIVVEP